MFKLIWTGKRIEWLLSIPSPTSWKIIKFSPISFILQVKKMKSEIKPISFDLKSSAIALYDPTPPFA